MGIALIPATLLAGAAATWLGMPGLIVMVICAVVIGLGAFAVSRDARTIYVTMPVAFAALMKFVVFAQPAFAKLLHTEYAAFSFTNSNLFVGALAAVSIPLSAFFGIYGPLQGRYRLNLFGGRIGNFLVTLAAWLGVSGALYAHFSGRDLVAVLVGIVAIALFVVSFRLHPKTEAQA
ncbi:hypothetical protein [Paraburkholderia youngii]|uniref:hypothetical protein n=1 Tax=Paraburkholderia youngii TaxID=2782701 RepID=UPI003D22F845